MKTLFSALVIPCLVTAAVGAYGQSYSILRDTSYYTNYGRPVSVVHTYLTHYYYLDTVCIKLTGSPQISGLSSNMVQNDLNREFANRFTFNECRENDKNCDMPPLKFGPVRATFSLLKVHYIKNDLLALITREGECFEDQNSCTQNRKYHMRDLRTGKEIESRTVFKKDADSRDAVMWLIVQQLDVLPDEPEKILENVQLYFDNNNIYFYYEKDAVENDEKMLFAFSYNVVSPYIDRKSPLVRLWKNEQIKNIQAERQSGTLKD
jgi:hypothetical protein